MTVQVTSMYLFAGFRDALVRIEMAGNRTLAEKVKANMGGGEVECAYTISQMAFTVEREVNRIYDMLNPASPGVWEYEVGEELGKWLCARAAVDMVPSDEELVSETYKQTLKFVKQWESNPA